MLKTASTRLGLLIGLLACASPGLAGSSRTVELLPDRPLPDGRVDDSWEARGETRLVAKTHPLAPEVLLREGLELSVSLPGSGAVAMRPLSLAVGARALAPGPGKPVELSEGRLLVEETWQGVDEELLLLTGGLKHDLLVSRSALETLGEGELAIRWSLDLPEGVSAGLEPDAGLVLRAADGSFLARIPPPLVADAGGSHPEARASLDWTGGILGLRVDADWLSDPARRFPLRLDPSITLFPPFTTRTGWVDEFGTKQTDAIDSGSLADVGFGRDVRGFAEFDSSAIPDSATILDVKLEVFLANHDNPDDPAVPLRIEVKALNERASAPAATLHAAIPPLFAGTIYATENLPRTGSSFCPDAFVFRSYDLGPLADGELQAKLPVDWFSIGFVSQIVTDPTFDHVDYIGVSEIVNNNDCPTRRLPGSRMRLIVEYVDDLPPDCDAGGPYDSGCPDGVVLLDGTGSSDPEGMPLDYEWSSDCPGLLEDAGEAVARLILDEPCSLSCTVTLVVDDGSNRSACSAAVTLSDEQAPVLADVPADASAPCDELPPLEQPSAEDDCDPAPLVRFLGEERQDGSCADEYTLLRSWQAEDCCGRLSEIAVQEISVSDDDPPTLEGVPPDATVPCDDIPLVAVPTAFDNCDPLPNVGFLGGLRDDGPCADSYTLRRRWRATDRCGNATEIAERVLTVVDELAPAFQSPPEDATVSCADVPAVPELVATDNCDPAPLVEFLGESREDGSCPDSYRLTRRWTAIDRCGNEAAELVQVLTVVDSEPPALLGVPADAAVPCDAVPPVGSPSAVDDCDPAPELEYLGELREDGPCPDSYLLRRRWQASDRCGNLAPVQEQVLTVSDARAPVFDEAPADEELSCGEVPSIPLLSASDDCDPEPAVEFLGETRSDGACPDSYELTRRWRAVDRCGNASAELVQVLTVSDLQAPILMGVPPDQSASCEALPPIASPTATDDCDPAPFVDFLGELREDGPCPDSYMLRRRWQARDRCGNLSAVEEQVIEVSDDVAPVFDSLPSDLAVSCDSVPAPPVLTASDACDPAPTVEFLGETRSDGACPDSYELTRRWSAVDRCGNAAPEIVQVVTVSDTQAPLLSGVPASLSVSCDAVPPVGSPSASDDCDPAPAVSYLGEIRDDGACPDDYTLTRRWQASDRCGNASEVAEQVIVVHDLQAPVLSGVPADATVECDAVPPPAAVSASDDCDPAPLLDFAETRVDGRCPGEYSLTRTWTATDRCGNVSSQSQLLSVVDTTPPVVRPPTGADLACLWPPNHRYVCFELDAFDVEVSDACSEPVTLELSGCESNQPDDAGGRDSDGGYNGDGHTSEDCLLTEEGRRVCVRSERAGTGPDAQQGRRYALTVVAVDACGNRSEPTRLGSIHVPHDQSPAADCVDATERGVKDKDLRR